MDIFIYKDESVQNYYNQPTLCMYGSHTRVLQAIPGHKRIHIKSMHDWKIFSEGRQTEARVNKSPQKGWCRRKFYFYRTDHPNKNLRNVRNMTESSVKRGQCLMAITNLKPKIRLELWNTKIPREVKTSSEPTEGTHAWSPSTLWRGIKTGTTKAWLKGRRVFRK